MKLYTTALAPNPRKVDCLIKAKGLDIHDIHNLEVIYLDINKHEHQTPAFTAINPLQRLPVLVLDDGTVLNDSQAICEYLDSRLAGNGKLLLGSDAVQKARITAMTRNAEFNVLYNAMLAFQHGHQARADSHQVAGMAAHSLERIQQALPYFDTLLANHKYLLDDRMTFADIVLYLGLDFGRVMKFDPKDGNLVGEHVARFYDMMHQKFGKK